MSMAADRFARGEIKENPSDLEPKKVTLAFDRQSVPKLIRCLSSEDIDIVTHSLEVLDDSILKQQKNVILFLKADGVQTLNELTCLSTEAEPNVVHLAVKCLVHVSAVNAGCMRMLETKSVPNVKQILSADEPPAAIKLTGYALLHTLSLRLECAKRLLKDQILSFLLDRIDNEEGPQLKTAAMNVITNCAHVPANPREPHKLVRRGGVEAVLNSGAVPASVALLAHDDVKVVASAARILQVCSVTEAGRDVVVAAGAVKGMTDLVLAKSVEVRRATTAALLSLTITEPGKKQFHKLQGCDNVADRLRSETAPVVMQNVIKIVSNMCCFPVARQQLKEAGAAEVLQGLAKDARDAETREIAEVARQNVLWEP